MRIVILILVALISAVIFNVAFAQQADNLPTQMIHLVYPTEDYAVCATMAPDGSSYSEIRIPIDEYYTHSDTLPSHPECNPLLISLSPSGEYWLQQLSDPSGTKLRIYDLRGHLLHTIFVEGNDENDVYVPNVTWYPDSEHVLYWDWHNARLIAFGISGERRDLASFATASGSYVIDHQGRTQIEISPNESEQALFVGKLNDESAANDVFAVRLDGSGVTNLTNSPDPEYSPHWSPDGRRIAYVRQTVYMAHVIGRSANARTGPGQNYPVVFTYPQGGEFAVKGQRNGWTQTVSNDDREVWVSDTLLSFSGGEYEALVINSDGSQPLVLGAGYNPTFSPDGTRIAYDCRVAPRQYSLCIADLGDNNSTPSVSERFVDVSLLSWSPDMHYVAYWGATENLWHGDLHILDVQSGRDQNLATVDLSFVGTIQWSADSRQFLFSFSLPSSLGLSYAGNTAIYVCTPTKCQPLPHMPDIQGEETVYSQAWWEQEH